MSKTALIKELAKMSHEQLEQIIIDAYEASKETKAYFDFFLNPDVEKLHERKLAAVSKELSRQKWGYCKARVTIIKKAVKDFVGYKPGVEQVLTFMYDVLRQFGTADRFLHLSGPQERYIAFLAAEMIDYGNTNMYADFAISRLNSLIENTEYRSYFRRLVSEVYERG